MGELEFAGMGIPKVNRDCFDADEVVWLGFLEGSQEVFKVFIRGRFSDIRADYDSWKVISARLLIFDDRFEKFCFVDDNGEF